MKQFLMLLLVFVFLSCSNHPGAVTKNAYSKQFSIHKINGELVLLTQNAEGIFLSKTTLNPSTLPKKIICLNTTHLAYFEALNALDKVVACVDLDRIPKKYGSIQSLSSAQLDLEKIMGLQPDLIIANSYQQKEIAFLKEKYPVLIVNEFWENHPLGRLEWLLFFGEICGQQSSAKRLYNGGEQGYKKYVLDAKPDSIKLLNLSKYNQSYFLPSCNSLMAQYFKDGKIPFDCSGNGSESIEISEEAAMGYFQKAKVLLFFDWYMEERSYASVAKDLGNPKLKLPIIYCNTFSSNYFQESITKPHEILNELKMALQNSQFRGKFFKRLNP